VNVFGQRIPGSFFPNYYVISNTYHLKDWLSGDGKKRWQEPPFFKSFCMYEDNRNTASSAKGILDLPAMLNIPGVLWMGSCLIGGLNSAFAKSINIKR